MSEIEATLERIKNRQGVDGYAVMDREGNVLRYMPGPPGYVSIVVVKRAGAEDAPGGQTGCCAHSADEALLPSKPSSETLIEVGN